MFTLTSTERWKRTQEQSCNTYSMLYFPQCTRLIFVQIKVAFAASVDMKFATFSFPKCTVTVSATCLNSLNISLQTCTSGVYASGRCDHAWTVFTPGSEMHFDSRRKGSTFCLTSIFPVLICHVFPCASPSSLWSKSTNSIEKSMRPQTKPIQWKLICFMSLSSLKYIIFSHVML